MHMRNGDESHDKGKAKKKSKETGDGKHSKSNAVDSGGSRLDSDFSESEDNNGPTNPTWDQTDRDRAKQAKMMKDVDLPASFCSTVSSRKEFFAIIAKKYHLTWLSSFCDLLEKMVCLEY